MGIHINLNLPHCGKGVRPFSIYVDFFAVIGIASPHKYFAPSLRNGPLSFHL